MTNQISSLAFAAFTFFLSYFEIKKYRTLITPFIVSMLPLVFISLAVNFLYVNIGIKPVTAQANFFLIIVSLCFFLGGLPYKTKASSVLNQNIDIFTHFRPYTKYKRLLYLFAIIIFILMLQRVLNLVNNHGGWLFLGTQKYEDIITRGLVAHLIVFGQAVFILLYLISYKTENKIISYAILFILGIAVFLMMVKYSLLWLIIMIFFFNNIGKPLPLQIKNILTTILVLAVFFTLYFVFLMLFSSSDSPYHNRGFEFFYKMLLNYLLSGPIVLSKWLQSIDVKPDWAIGVVFENLKNVIFNNPARANTVALLSKGFEALGGGLFSNTGTAFGTLYLVGGYPFVFFMTTIISSLSYYIYHRFMVKRTILTIFFMSYMLTINSLNFFGLYFTILSFYEFPMFFIILISAMSLYNKIGYHE